MKVTGILLLAVLAFGQDKKKVERETLNWEQGNIDKAESKKPFGALIIQTQAQYVGTFVEDQPYSLSILTTEYCDKMQIVVTFSGPPGPARNMKDRDMTKEEATIACPSQAEINQYWNSTGETVRHSAEYDDYKHTPAVFTLNPHWVHSMTVFFLQDGKWNGRTAQLRLDYPGRPQ